jgi:hypothetical protein
MRWRILLSLIFLSWSACQSAAQTSQIAEGSASVSAGGGIERKLIIGVRGDAAPFSYRSRNAEQPLTNLTAKSGPLRAEGFDGYMIYICDEVLKLMLINEAGTPVLKPDEVRLVDIDLQLASRAGTDRFTLLENDEIDIMCDPATISRERVRAFAASPPLFLTGIGYLILRDKARTDSECEPSKALIGVVGTTNAVRSGVSAILEAGELPELRSSINLAMRYLENPESVSKPCADEKGYEGVIWQAPNHRSVAEAFCKGEISYYVGDLEIIRESIKRFPGCDATSGIQRFTSDRYAIFADMDYKDSWKWPLMARFFEVLNREIIASDSLLDRAYAATFGDAPRSERLDLFYWSIRGAP